MNADDIGYKTENRLEVFLYALMEEVPLQTIRKALHRIQPNTRQRSPKFRLEREEQAALARTFVQEIQAETYVSASHPRNQKP